MSQPGPLDEQPGRGGGLVDPRVIHPSPEGVFPDIIEVPETESDQPPPGKEAPTEEDVRGIVDPRSEAAGPDI